MGSLPVIKRIVEDDGETAEEEEEEIPEDDSEDLEPVRNWSFFLFGSLCQILVILNRISNTSLYRIPLYRYRNVCLLLYLSHFYLYRPLSSLHRFLSFPPLPFLPSNHPPHTLSFPPPPPPPPLLRRKKRSMTRTESPFLELPYYTTVGRKKTCWTEGEWKHTFSWTKKVSWSYCYFIYLFLFFTLLIVSVCFLYVT